MKRIKEWKLSEMPIGTELMLVYDEDLFFTEQLRGTLTNNDFQGFVELTDERGREFVLEYDIIREVTICRTMESALRQTPPGAKVFFSAGPEAGRVPDQEGIVVSNDMACSLIIRTERGEQQYLYQQVRSFLVREIPRGAVCKGRRGLSWRVPRDYLKLSDRALHDSFLLLPRADKQKLSLSYEKFLSARRSGNSKALKKAAQQMKWIILWEEEKGYYWSSDAVCLCGAILHLAEETDHEIYLVGECFGAAALACWHQGLYTLGGAYAILSVLEENPCCTEELAVILASGVLRGRDISGLELLARRITPEMKPYLEQILDEAFLAFGLRRSVGQSIPASLDVLRPLYRKSDMARELQSWGEAAGFRSIPGLQISRAPKLNSEKTPVPAAG